MKASLVLCFILAGISCAAAVDWSQPTHRSTKLTRSTISRALRAISGTSQAQGGYGPAYASGSLSRRQLAQAHGSDCMWEGDVCSLKSEKAMNMMEGTKSPLAEFFKAIYRCGKIEAYESCSSDEWCHWVIDECIANDSYLEDESVSHCLGKAGIFFDISKKAEECSIPNRDGLNGCDKDIEGCMLNKKNECEFDFWMYMIGVPSGTDGLQGLDKATVHQAHFWTQALLDDLPFLLSTDASRYLDWTPPKADCPDGVAQIVCDYAAPLGQVFATTLYCNSQHQDDVSGCQKDSRCQRENSQCKPSDAVVAEVTKKQIQVLSDYSDEDALFSDLLFPFVTCSSKTESSCGDECKWDPRENQCSPDDAWILQRLSTITSESPEPRCRVLTAVFASGCPAASSPECAANPKCSWNLSEGECEASTSEMTSVLTSVAPDIREVVLKQVECDSHADQATCLQ